MMLSPSRLSLPFAFPSPGELVRRAAPAVLAASTVTCAPTAPGPIAPGHQGERAAQIHRAALTLDAHIDLRPDFNTKGNLASSETVDQFDLPKLERGELDVATIALFAPTQRRTPENIAAAREEVDRKLAAIRDFVAAHPDRLEFARSSQDLERIPASGRHAILLSYLNAFSLREDLSDLPQLFDAGVRVLGLAHVGDNLFAHSSRPVAAFGDDVQDRGGLTALGLQAVDALNRLGIVVDVSQLTHDGVLQTVARSRAPLIASHSSVKGKVDASRNLGDDELRAIAKAGGVVHVVAFHAWVKPSQAATADFHETVLAPFGLTPSDDAQTKLDPARYAQHLAAYTTYSRRQWHYASLADYVDAIDYAVRLVGIDHVGVSSDFNHGGGVTGFAHVGEAPNLTRELLQRGYSEAQIRKLWGENFLRVMREVERVAGRTT